MVRRFHRLMGTGPYTSLSRDLTSAGTGMDASHGHTQRSKIQPSTSTTTFNIDMEHGPNCRGSRSSTIKHHDESCIKHRLEHEEFDLQTYPSISAPRNHVDTSAKDSKLDQTMQTGMTHHDSCKQPAIQLENKSACSSATKNRITVISLE